MNQSPNRIQIFLAELKRRQVFKVATVYGATAFVLVEGADLSFNRLGLPDWTVTLVLALAILGFPVALILAWAYDLTPKGMQRTDPAASGELAAIVSEPRRRRWLSGLLATGATVLLIAAVWLAGGRRLFTDSDEIPVPASTSSSAVSVAVVPFAVQGNPDFDYLEDGMVNLLATKLDGAGDLRSVDARALLRYVEREGLAADDPGTARAIVELFDADLYITGSLVEAGGRIQLAAALHEADGEEVSRADVEGDVDGLFELVDELSAQLLSGMSGGPASRVRRIAAVTTASLPALKHFLEGEELFRRAQFGAAVEAFQDAVAEDSTFALAYYRLSLVAEWNLQDELARQTAEQAVRYDRRLSDRDRRLLEAFLVRRRGANSEAERVYRSILGTNPDEMEAWLDLAEILFHANPLAGRSFVDSREALDKVLAFDPSHSTALIHLSRVAAYEGDQTELDSLAERFMVLNPEPERTLEIQALRAFSAGDEAGIAVTMTRLDGAEDLAVALAVWATTVYARNLEGAEQVAELLTDPHRSPEARRLGYAWLAHLSLAAGKWMEAQARFDELAQLSEGIALEYRALLSNVPFVDVGDEELRQLVTDLNRLDPAILPTSNNPSIVFTAHDRLHPLIRSYLLGLTEARLGSASLASRFADETEFMEVSRTAGSMPQDLARSIRSQILLWQGEDAEALVEMEQLAVETWYGQTMASPLYCQVYERFTRAELLHRLGRHQEALDWYASLVETSPFELPYLAVAHLRRAEIYDELDQPERAAEHYARFVEMWKDADPRFQPMVESASRRLEELEVTGS